MPATPYTSTLALDRAVAKQNDTYPAMVIYLSDSDGPIDLTTATLITLILKGNTSATLVTGTCTASDAHAGQAIYTWAATDLATPDVYQAEAEIVWPGSSPVQRQTVPNAYASNPTLTVVQQLNPGADE